MGPSQTHMAQSWFPTGLTKPAQIQASPQTQAQTEGLGAKLEKLGAQTKALKHKADLQQVL